MTHTRRIRGAAGRGSHAGPRRLGTRAALAALTLAALATASATLPLPTRASAGPASTAHDSTLGPCRIATAVGVQMSEGVPTPAGYSRSTGTVRALNLMVDFSDAPGPGSAADRLGEFFPQTSQWFRTSSYGRLDYRPEAPVKDWLRMPLPFADYGIERGAPYEPGYRRLVQDIVTVADPEVDFSEYDLVNILVTPNAGPSALDTVLSVTFSGNGEAPEADGVPLANTSFVYSRQDDGSGSYARTGYRVLPHENGHVFGLPDLYTMDGGGAVGHWDIMSEDWGPTTICWAGTSGSSAGSTTSRSAARRPPATASTTSHRWPPGAVTSWRSCRSPRTPASRSRSAPARATTRPSASRGC